MACRQGPRHARVSMMKHGPCERYKGPRRRRRTSSASSCGDSLRPLPSPPPTHHLACHGHQLDLTWRRMVPCGQRSKSTASHGSPFTVLFWLMPPTRPSDQHSFRNSRDGTQLDPYALERPGHRGKRSAEPSPSSSIASRQTQCSACHWPFHEDHPRAYATVQHLAPVRNL